MSKVINKTIRVYQKQRKFLESSALLRAFVGGVGSGKSFIGSLDLIRRSKSGRLYLVTAPTYPMLSDATFRSVQSMGSDLGIVGVGDSKTSPPPSIRFSNGAEVLFRSTDNPETLRGPNLSGIWMDEASLSKRGAFDILIGRLREGGEQGWLSATFTPKGKAHWTYKVFGSGQPDTDLIHASSIENPFLPQGFVGRVAKMYTGQQIRQELGGEFLEGGGNHYVPSLWPRYVDTGDAYKVRLGDRWHHYKKSECVRLLTLDWAMGKPKKDDRPKDGPPELTGDCTAFLVADMTEDEDGLLFLLWAVNERIPIGGNAPRLAEMCRRWSPLVVASDDDNLTETMMLECRRHTDIPTIKTLPIGSRNKVTRSQAAIVRAERGKMYLPALDGVSMGRQDHEWVGMLSDQLSTFTGTDGDPDDVADCVSLMGRLADEFRPGDADDFEPKCIEPGMGGGYDGGW